MGLLVLLFLDLATVPAARTAGPAADDLAVYQHALSDVARSDRQVAEGTVSERCRVAGLDNSRVAPETLADYVEKNRGAPKLPSQIRSRLFFNSMNREPQEVQVSAVGWSRDRNQAWLEISLYGFDNRASYCLLYQRTGANFRLLQEVRLPKLR